MEIRLKDILKRKDEIKTTFEELANIAEPSFKEFKTTEYIVEFLEKNNIPIDVKCKTGCFGTIDIGAKKTVALRADIDALPVDEKGEKFAHLCGHNGHTAALMHTLIILNKKIDSLKCNIRYIFQPAEETGTGALFLIEKGAMEGVDEIFGLHGDPNNNLGEISIQPGELMAGSSLFKITFSGNSTHAAFPHKGSDVIIAMSDYINLCQKIITRFKDPVEEGVISFCKVNGGSAPNILPSSVSLEGTFRFFSTNVKEMIVEKMKDALFTVEKFYKISTDFRIEKGTIPLINSKELSEALLHIFENSELKIICNSRKMMGSEDFSYFLKRAPGVYLKVGIATSDNQPPLHNKNFSLSIDAVIFYIYTFLKIAFNR